MPQSRERRLLERAFGMPMAILDGDSGNLLSQPPEQPVPDWALIGELCREVARRRRPEFIGEQNGLLRLAVPLLCPDGGYKVAVGTFLTRALAGEEERRAAAEWLGLEPSQVLGWAAGQALWTSESLLRVAGVVGEQCAAGCQIEQLKRESQALSDNLSLMYEEISLLHRITQNLRISESDEELARLTLEWLQAALPAEGIAVQFAAVAAEEGKSVDYPARIKPVLLTCGKCPIDSVQFDRLIDHFHIAASQRPLVANQTVTQTASWPWPAIRQLIMVPLVEGRNTFGWLAAFNHMRGMEFGTVEASLLNSVGAILGIHSGNIELYRQQSELFTGIVHALTSAIDAKDPYTCGHSDRVARVAVRLAQELGCDQQSVHMIYLAGLLHDIGKIGVSDAVLRKTGRLTTAEYEHVKAHVQIGHRILVDLKTLDDVLPVVLHHHERWDGAGYPQGLKGEQIPLAARILAVADAFDAMASNRPYRRGMADNKIDETFRAGAGKQWDPRVIEAFSRAWPDSTEIVARALEDAPDQHKGQTSGLSVRTTGFKGHKGLGNSDCQRRLAVPASPPDD
jgi:putative nucleotidyltransferase with HDIG domain